MWLLVLGKLKTKRKLLKMQLIDDDHCPTCLSKAESVGHIFFECPFSFQCLREIGNLLQLTTIPQKLVHMINFNWKMNHFQKNVTIASIYSLLYYIWKTGNHAVWHRCMNPADIIMKISKYELKVGFSTLSSTQSPTDLWFRD